MMEVQKKKKSLTLLYTQYCTLCLNDLPVSPRLSHRRTPVQSLVCCVQWIISLCLCPFFFGIDLCVYALSRLVTVIKQRKLQQLFHTHVFAQNLNIIIRNFLLNRFLALRLFQLSVHFVVVYTSRLHRQNVILFYIQC